MRYFTRIRDNPEASDYMRPKSLHRLDRSPGTIITQRWNKREKKWVDDPNLIAFTGIGGADDFREIDKRTANNLLRSWGIKEIPESAIQRHGKHSGQEGRPGEQGGSQEGFTHDGGGGEKPRWAGDKHTQVQGHNLYSGKFGDTKNQWAVDTPRGGPGGFRDTPEEAIRDYEKAVKMGEESAAASDAWKKSIQQISQGNIDDSTLSGLGVQYGGISTTMANDIMRELGIKKREDQRRILNYAGISGTSAGGATYYQADEVLRLIQEKLGVIERHGKHVGQEGREGEQGGSAPGFTHDGGSGEKNGNGDWNPEDDNTIEFGRKVALDEEFDEEDEARGIEFRNSANQVLKDFYEKTGIKPKGLTITNSHLELADTIIEGQDFPGLNRYELAGYLADRSLNRNVVGSYENETLWLEDVLPGKQAPGGKAWNATAYHELGHWVHNDVLDGFQKGDIVTEIIGSDRYIDEAKIHYGMDTARLRREYVADMFAAMVNQTNDSTPAFHRWGLGTFNEREIADFAILKLIVGQAIKKSPEISRAFVDELSGDRQVIVLLPEGSGEILIVTAEEAYRNNWPENVEIIDPAFPIGENPVLAERILGGAVERHGEHEGQQGVEGQQGGSAKGYSHKGSKNAEKRKGGREGAASKPKPLDLPEVNSRTVEPEEFAEIFSKAMEGNERAAFVTEHGIEELANMKALYVNEDGTAGLAILEHEDGKIEATAGFNNGAPKNTTLSMIAASIENDGVNYAEAFGPFLPAYYSRVGFVTTETVPFSDDQAPANWNYERDKRPDYHFMRVGK